MFNLLTNGSVSYTHLAVYKRQGHFILTALLIGFGVGALLGFGSAVYDDYQDDGQVFNGSVSGRQYVGRTLGGGITGTMAAATGGTSLPMTIAGGMMAASTGDAVDQLISTGKIDYGRNLNSALWGGSGATIGKYLKGVSSAVSTAARGPSSGLSLIHI